MKILVCGLPGSGKHGWLKDWLSILITAHGIILILLENMLMIGTLKLKEELDKQIE